MFFPFAFAFAAFAFAFGALAFAAFALADAFAFASFVIPAAQRPRPREAHFLELPGCGRSNTAARCGAQRPRRGCGVAAEQRRRDGRQGRRWPGPQSGKHAPDIESRTWGISKPDKNVSGLKFLHFQ